MRQVPWLLDEDTFHRIPGGVDAGGSALVTYRYHYVFDGGFELGSQVTQTLFGGSAPDGGFALEGSAAVSTSETTELEGGGVVVNGNPGPRWSEVGSGGIVAAGPTRVTCRYSPQVTGGGVLGTEGSYNLNDTITVGGVIIASGVSSVFRIYEVSVSGGVVCGGDAPPSWYETGSGGAVGGSSAEESHAYSPTLYGGAELSGEVIPYGWTTQYTFGGAVVSGLAALGGQRNAVYTASGEIVLGSLSDLRISSTNEQGAGGAVCAGLAATNHGLTVDLNFSWRVRTNVQVDLDFFWNTGQLRIFFYRVIGRGKQGDECDPLKADPCCQKFVMNVHARTVSELCEKLSKRKFNWPIERVDRFSRPGENTAIAEDAANGINNDCNELEPVDICVNSKCADFCVDFDLIETIEFGTKLLVNAFLEYEAAGSIAITGSADVTLVRFIPDFPHVASGGPEIGGSADVISSGYFYAGTGSLALESVYLLEASDWTFVGGQWPHATTFKSGKEALSLEEDPADSIWSVTERVLLHDGLAATSDVSFLRTSEFLIVKGFNLNIPAGMRILGIEVHIDRMATNLVRDNEVYLVVGDDIVSDNLAKIDIDWPFLFSTMTYGSLENDWRDETSDDFLGEWDIDDLNSTEFGVAIRVQGLSLFPAVHALIDHIEVNIHFEEESHQKLRLGGASRVVSMAHSHTSTGRVEISGHAIAHVTRNFVSSGLGITLAPAIRIAGTYEQHFSYESEFDASLTLGSDVFAKPSYQNLVGLGGATGSGESLVTPYFEFPAGGATGSGEAYLTAGYIYEASGSIGLSGTGFPLPEESYVATGSLSIAGSAKSQCSAFHWISDGNAIFIGGTADVIFSDYGTLMLSFEADMSVVDFKFNFAIDQNVESLGPAVDTVNKCACIDLPLAVGLRHNLAQNNKLAQFLVRNNLSISRTLSLLYNAPNDSWQTNLYYKGLSADANTEEVWRVLFELQCSNLIGGTSIGKTIWKLAIQLQRSILITNEDFDTKIVVGLIPDLLCATGNLLFSFEYDTQLDFVEVSPNATVYQNLIYDNIGLFKNQYWISNPNLVISVSQNNLTPLVPRYDLTSVVSA